MALKDWSATAADNDIAGAINFAEGQLPSMVNNSARQLMADVRSAVDDMEWRDWGHAPTYISATSFSVTGNQTAVYVVGRRVRMTDATTLYGTILTSVFGALTTVTMAMDSGSLSASLSAVSLGWNADKASGAVAGYYSGRNVYLNGDTPAAASPFSIDPVIGAAWESVGPTGSGATNIWAALDIVPTYAKGVVLKVKLYAEDIAAASTVRQVRNSLYARKTGSVAGIGEETLAAQIEWNVIISGANLTQGVLGPSYFFVTIPVDTSRRFDLYNSFLGTSRITAMSLAGWVDSLL